MTRWSTTWRTRRRGGGNPYSSYDPDADGYAPFSQTWTYNQRNQVAQIQTQVATYQGQQQPWAAAVTDLNYGYNLADGNGNSIAGTSNGQATSVASGLDPTGVNSAYRYDQLGRLTSVTGFSGGNSQQYTYDGWGNLTSKTGDGQNFTLNIDPGSNRIYGGGICYDPNGKTTGAQNGCDVDYGYDISNRLVRAGSTLGGQEQYLYTSDNKRVTTLKPINPTVSGTFQQVFYVQGARGDTTMCYSKYFGLPLDIRCELTELKWAGLVIRQNKGFFNNLTFANDRYSGATVVTDRVGSVVSIGVGIGGGVTSQHYLPYGDGPAATGTPETGKSGFATYWSDTNTGLSYADQRYYNGQFGRFMSADPYRASAGPEDSGSWNRYSYTRNDPVNRVLIGSTDANLLRAAYLFHRTAPGQPEDYKQYGTNPVEIERLRAFGNYNYGAIAQALGLGMVATEWAAGVASSVNIWVTNLVKYQLIQGPPPQFGTPFTSRPYGDNPLENSEIQSGYSFSTRYLLGECP